MLIEVRWPTDLCHNRVNLLHAQREDAGQEGLESMTRLLHHHLQDFQELLHHSTPCTALLQNTGCQLFPAAHTSDIALISVITTFSVFAPCHLNLYPSRQDAILLWIQLIKLAIVSKELTWWTCWEKCGLSVLWRQHPSGLATPETASRRRPTSHLSHLGKKSDNQQS